MKKKLKKMKGYESEYDKRKKEVLIPLF